MTTRSLAFRLFAAAAVWVIVVLVIAGGILVSYYRTASENAFDERLHVYLKSIVAALASLDAGERAAPGGLGEPRFEVPLSGWYWQITRLDKDKPEITGSKSLFDVSLPSLADLGIPAQVGGVREGYVEGPDNQNLRAVERGIDLGTDGRYRIIVTAPSDDIDKDIIEFEKALVITFVLLGIGLVATTLLQVRFGLVPLKRMSATLAAIRAGRAEKMPPGLPDEIEPLARELDALVDSNKQIVERARTHVGNLAHALKTPLSVIANEAGINAGPLAERILHQTAIMRDQIEHHLQRARIAAAVSIVGTVTDVRPVIEGLARAMEKLHRAKDLAVTIDISEEPRFRGERQDLEEMVGNLIDNACKWATGAVVVQVRPVERDGRPYVAITIDDDGPGVSKQQRAELGRRGKRLDETMPGTGLGLAIVNDLASLYGGHLTLDESPDHGLRARLDLPAVVG